MRARAPAVIETGVESGRQACIQCDAVLSGELLRITPSASDISNHATMACAVPLAVTGISATVCPSAREPFVKSNDTSSVGAEMIL